MKLFIFALIAALCLGLTAAANQDVYVIDNFDVYSEALLVVTTDSTTFPASDFSFVQDAAIFSGERDHLLTVTTAPKGNVFSSSADQGQYSSSAPSAGTAFTLLQYDGVDGDLDLDTSGGLSDPDNDFTAGAAFALHLVIDSDQPSTVEVFVYSGATENDFCSFTFNIPGNNQKADYVANYNQFSKSGSGCDFTNVGAVELVTSLPPNVDIIVELFATYGLVASTPSRTPAPSKNPCNCFCPAFHCVLEYDPSNVNTFYYDISELDPNDSGSTRSSRTTRNTSNTSNTSNNSSSDASTLTVGFALVVAVVALLF